MSPRSSKDNSKRSGTSEEKPLPTEPETPNPIRQVTIVKRHRSQDLQEQVLSPKETEELGRKLSRSKLSKGKSNSSVKRRGSSKSRSIRGAYYDRQKHNASKSPTGQRLEPVRGGSGMSDGSIGAIVQGNETTGQATNYRRQVSVPPASSKSPESRKLSFTERTRSLTKRISSSDFSKSRSGLKADVRENQPIGPLRQNDDSHAARNASQDENSNITGQSKAGRSRTRTLTDKTRSLGRRISRGDLLARKRTAAKNQSNTTIPQLPQGRPDFDKAESTLNTNVPSTQNPRKRSVTADDQYEPPVDSAFQGDQSNGTITLYELSGDTTFSKDMDLNSVGPKVNSESQIHMEKNWTRQERQEITAFVAPQPKVTSRPNEDIKQNDPFDLTPTKRRPGQDGLVARAPADQLPSLNPRKLRKKSLDENAFRPQSAKSQKSFPSHADGRRPSLTRKVQKALFGDRSGESGRAMSMPSSLRPIGEKPPRIPTPEPSAFLTQGLDEVIEKWKKDDSLAGRQSPKQNNLRLPSSTDGDGQRPHSARSGSYSLFPTDTNRSTTPRPSRPTSSVDVQQDSENETRKPDLDRPLLPGRNPTFTSHPPNMALGTPPSISRVTELSNMPVMQASPARTPLPQDSEQHKSMVLEIDTATLATRNSTYTTSTPGADPDVPSLPSSLPTSAHPGTDGPEKSELQHTEVSRPTSSAFDKAELPLGTRDMMDAPTNQTEAMRAPSPENSHDIGPTPSVERPSPSKELPQPPHADQELKQGDSQKSHGLENSAKGDPSPVEKAAHEEKAPIHSSSNKAVKNTPKEATSPKAGPSHLAEVVLARARPRFPDRSYQRRSFPSLGSWADANFGRLNPVEEESDHHEPLDRSQSASQVNTLRSERIKNVGATTRRRPLSASFAQGPLFNASKERVDELMLPKSRPQSMYNTSNLDMDGAGPQTDLRTPSSASTVKPARESDLKHLSQVTVLGPASAPSNVNDSEDPSSHPVEEALQRLLEAHEDENRGSPRRLSNSSAADALKTLTGEFDRSSGGGETADEAYKRLTFDGSGTLKKPSVPEKDRNSNSPDPALPSKGEPNISRRRSPVKQLLVHAMSGALPPLSTTTITSKLSTQEPKTTPSTQTPLSAYHSPVSAVSAYPSPTNKNRTHHLSSPIQIPTSFASPYVSIGTQTSPHNKHANGLSSSKRHSWAGTPTPTSAATTTTLTPPASLPTPPPGGNFFALPLPLPLPFIRRRSRTLGSSNDPLPNTTARPSSIHSTSSKRHRSHSHSSSRPRRRLSTAEAEAEAGIFRVQFPTISSEVVNVISRNNSSNSASSVSVASSLRRRAHTHTPQQKQEKQEKQEKLKQRPTSWSSSSAAGATRPRLSLNTSPSPSRSPGGGAKRAPLHIGPGFPRIVPQSQPPSHSHSQSHPPPFKPPPQPSLTASHPLNNTSNSTGVHARSASLPSSSASTTKEKEREKALAKRRSKTRHIGEAAHERERERERKSMEETRSVRSMKSGKSSKSMKARKEKEKERARASSGVGAGAGTGAGTREEGVLRKEKEKEGAGKKGKGKGLGIGGRLWRRVLPAVGVVNGLKKGDDKNKGKGVGVDGLAKGIDRPGTAGGGTGGGGVLMGGGGGDVRVFKGVGRDGRWVGG